MKVRDAIRVLLDGGWYRVATRGSHHQYTPRSQAASPYPALETTIWRPEHWPAS
jgi:hypothetical protein